MFLLAALSRMHWHVHAVSITATSGTAISPYAAAGYSDGVIMLSKLSNGRLAASPKLLLDVPHEEGYSNKVRSLHVVDDLLVAGRDDGNITVWELETYAEVANIAHANVSAPTAVTAVAGKHRRVVSGGDDSTLKVWSLDRNGMLTLNNTIPCADKVLAIAVLDDNTIAVSDWDRDVTRKASYKVSILTNITSRATTVQSFYSSTPVLSLDFSPDGRHLATGAGPARSSAIATVWELNSLNSSRITPKIKVFRQHSDAIVSVRWSPDGMYLVTGSSDTHVRVFNVFDVYSDDSATGGLTQTFRNVDKVTSVAFFDLGSIVWTVNTGEVIWQELISPNRTFKLDRPPLGRTVASGFRREENLFAKTFFF